MSKGYVQDGFRDQIVSQTGGWMINLKDGKVILVEETYRIFGVDKNRFNKTFRGILKYIHPDDVKPMLEFGNKILRSTTSDYYELEHRIVRQEGEVRILKEILKTNFDKDGKLHMISGTASDVTERRLADRALKESEERYRSIFECSLAILITVDNDRKITGFNPEAYKVFGYTPDEILHKDISTLYANPDDEERVSRSLKETGKFVGKVMNLRKNGESFGAQLSASILYNADGKKVGTVGSSLELKE